MLTGAVDGKYSDQDDAPSDYDEHATVWDFGKGVLSQDVEVRSIRKFCGGYLSPGSIVLIDNYFNSLPLL